MHYTSIKKAQEAEAQIASRSGTDPFTFDLDHYLQATPLHKEMGRSATEALCDDLDVHPRSRQRQTFRRQIINGSARITLDRIDGRSLEGSHESF